MKKNIIIGLLLAALTSVCNAVPTTNAEITVTWTMPIQNVDGSPLTDLAGAKIYYRAEGSNYTNMVDVGLTNVLTITGLKFGVTYFITGTAYNTAGYESDFCEAILKQAKKPKPIKDLK